MQKPALVVILLLLCLPFLGCQDSSTKAKDTATNKPVGKVSVPKAPTPYASEPLRAPRLEPSFPPPDEDEALEDKEAAGSSKEKPELSDSKEFEPNNSIEYEPQASHEAEPQYAHEPEPKNSVVEEPSDSREEPPAASQNGGE